MAPEVLERVLDQLPKLPDPDARVLLGTEGHEDAAIVRMPAGKALVQTVDVLSPIGRDPYVFGQIAAANALSDVYAMGGEPWCAMNVAFFPVGAQAEAEGLSLDVLSAILRGGANKLAEAGAVLAGGHTVEDPEPKYGLSVTGIIDPDYFASNRGLCPGDILVLTKPLGVGILSTAVKARWEGWEAAEAEYCGWASRLNAGAAKLIRAMRLKAATDITGFGLGGHALEMAEASVVTVVLDAEAVPLMDKVLEYAADGLVPVGSHANKRHCACRTHVSATLNPLRELALFDAQTSGGLLLALPKAGLNEGLSLLEEYGEQGWIVGRVETQRADGLLLELR